MDKLMHVVMPTVGAEAYVFDNTAALKACPSSETRSNAVAFPAPALLQSPIHASETNHTLLALNNHFSHNQNMQPPMAKNQHLRRVSASPLIDSKNGSIDPSPSVPGPVESIIDDPKSTITTFVPKNPYLKTLKLNRDQEVKNWEEIRAFMRTDTFCLFFAAFLTSSVSEHIHTDLWPVLCERFHITKPTKPIQASYENPKDHFDVRAALILEETRYRIHVALKERWQNCMSAEKKLVRKPIFVNIHDISTRRHGITTLSFQAPLEIFKKLGKRKFFSNEEKEFLVKGALFECMAMEDDQNKEVSKSVLGCIISFSPQVLDELGQFEVMIAQPVPSKKCKWVLYYVDNFIHDWRKFEAVTQYAANVPFLKALLGNNALKSNSLAATKSKNAASTPSQLSQKECSVTGLNIPPLNVTQEKAVTSFLDSDENSITLVQGPPGTGKTTLLCAAICRWLLQPGATQHVVVCAPTNKAVSVLASRFLRAAENSSVNFAILGSAKKILGTSKRSPLHWHFVYDWHSVLKEEFKSLLKSLNGIVDFESPEVDGKKICQFLLQRLQDLPVEFREKVENLRDVLNDNTVDRKKKEGIAKQVEKAFLDLPADALDYDFMKSSRVIFTTLSNSASVKLKQLKSAGTLIIDEAAAATEADLYIPFHLQPSRLFAVGDPKQLPSVVLSERAKRLGQDKSLHHRLMTQCGAEFTMLDVQYRMHPTISEFPSKHFYSGKLLDGEKSAGEQLSPLFSGAPLVFLQVDHCQETVHNGSLCNHKEANAVVQLAKKVVNTGDSDHFRVITFYKAQVALLKKELAENGCKDVLVSTVDACQGCEADIVIVSFVRTSSAGFLDDEKPNECRSHSCSKPACLCWRSQ